jgi:predicted RNA-binding Zn-ribbon protein involved in translation (DUF1610 family)
MVKWVTSKCSKCNLIIGHEVFICPRCGNNKMEITQSW